ncbi:hypothetical protein JHD47_07760, partial [Sulfurimonas sp. SAG-AH-194-L11]|nr:hypothetical protein [Sulfurimonas sp. SAG-AH-194-L11]
MMILSSIYNTKQTLGLYILLLGVIIYFGFEENYIAAGIMFFTLISTLLLSLMDGDACSKVFNDSLMRQIRTVLLQAGQGQLSHRITHIDDTHTLQGVAWGVNNLLDQTEQFMRDISASVQAANTGRDTRN